MRGHSEAYPDRGFDGVVSTVVARSDEATRSVTVRGDFPNADRALRPGMLLEIALQRPQRQALLVPEIAIVQVGTDSFVYRVTGDGTVERAVVDVGARRDGLAEITRGVKAGERVVVDGTVKLRPGSRITESGVNDVPAKGAPAKGAAK